MNLYKKRRKIIIDNILYFLDILKIKKEVYGTWIRSFHFMSPFIGIFIILFFNKISSIFYILYLFILIFLFHYYKGCYLSIIEKKLCNNDINIVDILLPIFYDNIEEDKNKRRYDITIKIGILYLIFCLTVYYYRFIK